MIRFVPIEKSRGLFEDMAGIPSLNNQVLMKTDIHELEDCYVLEMDLAGYGKDQVQVSLYNGNLTVGVVANEEKSEPDSAGRIIRRERFKGSASRTFYVGKAVREEDIHASFKDGVLVLRVDKTERKQEERKKTIEIQ